MENLTQKIENSFAILESIFAELQRQAENPKPTENQFTFTKDGLIDFTIALHKEFIEQVHNAIGDVDFSNIKSSLNVHEGRDEVTVSATVDEDEIRDAVLDGLASIETSDDRDEILLTIKNVINKQK